MFFSALVVCAHIVLLFNVQFAFFFKARRGTSRLEQPCPVSYTASIFLRGVARGALQSSDGPR